MVHDGVSMTPEIPTLAEVKRRYITRMVRQFGPIKAAELLDIGKTTVFRSLREWGLDTRGNEINEVAK